MNTCYITTVGTSLLTNRDEALPEESKRPWAGWKRQTSLPTLCEVNDWLSNADAQLASAELNTLFQLKPDDSDTIVLLHSQTEEGKLCAQALKNDVQTRFAANGQIDEIDSLGYIGGSESSKGLRSLAELLIKYHRAANAQSLIVKFCATGGFKSEIAFSNLIGLLTGCEVYYIHEQYRELVRLPALPIAENKKFMQDNEKFFSWIEEDIRSEEDARSWMHDPRIADLIDVDNKGNVFLNPAAHLLYRLYLEDSPVTWPEESKRLPEEKNQISDIAHHRPDGWQTLLNKLCNHPYVETVRYTDFKPGKSIEMISEDELQINFKQSMGFHVETTSTNHVQQQRIIEHIKNTILR